MNVKEHMVILSYEDVVDEIKLFSRSFGSQAKLARKMKVSPAYICRVLQGKQRPSGKILKAMGLKCVKSYQRIKTT